MKTAKAKGQRASKEVRDLLLTTFQDLEEEDIRVTPSGVSGVDILLSPKAQSRIPLDIEVKNQENVSIWKWLEQAKKNAKAGTPVVVFRKNSQKLHICLEFNSFLALLRKS